MFRRIVLVATLSATMLMSTAPAASAVDLSGLGSLGPALAGAATTVVTTVVGTVVSLV